MVGFSLTARYKDAVAKKRLVADAAQEKALGVVDRWLSDLRHYPRKPGILARLLRVAAKPMHGLYLHGPVGRGKTMLMDWTLEALWAQKIRAERWHFHAFMLDIHRSLHDHAAHMPHLENRVEHLADQWAKRLDVLCFDEFHVTDVADAMIMMPLFTRLFDRGVLVVATSNWAPKDLYSGGLQRDRFVPFIAVIEAEMQVVALAGEQDHRQHQDGFDGWLQPLTADTAERFDALFRDKVGYESIETHEMHVGGRTWSIRPASRYVAWLDMADVLTQPIGAADFLALAKRYKTIFLDNLTAFGDSKNEQAKRFMVMIDALYDAGVTIMVRADSVPQTLYPPNGKLGFEFARTLSRLTEMTANTDKNV